MKQIKTTLIEKHSLIKIIGFIIEN
jgi:hypothetical protein